LAIGIIERAAEKKFMAQKHEQPQVQMKWDKYSSQLGPGLKNFSFEFTFFFIEK